MFKFKALLFCLCFLTSPLWAAEKPIVNLLQMVEHPALDATRQGICDELATHDIQVDYEIAQNNPALAAQIAQKFVGNRTTILIGIGTQSTQALIAAARQQIPIVFSSVSDPLKAQIVNDLNRPDQLVTGVSNFIPSAQSFRFFKSILPAIKKLGVIYNPGESNSIALLKDMEQSAPPYGLEIIALPANSTAEVAQSTQYLVHKADALFINNDNTALSAFKSIIKIAAQHQIPVFVSDVDRIGDGALAAIGPNQYQIGRQTGAYVFNILQGKAIKNLPVCFPDKIEIALNLDVAKRLKINIPESAMNQATQLIKTQ